MSDYGRWPSQTYVVLVVGGRLMVDDGAEPLIHPTWPQGGCRYHLSPLTAMGCS